MAISQNCKQRAAEEEGVIRSFPVRIVRFDCFFHAHCLSVGPLIRRAFNAFFMWMFYILWAMRVLAIASAVSTLNSFRRAHSFVHRQLALCFNLWIQLCMTYHWQIYRKWTIVCIVFRSPTNITNKQQNEILLIKIDFGLGFVLCFVLVIVLLKFRFDEFIFYSRSYTWLWLIRICPVVTNRFMYTKCE